MNIVYPVLSARMKKYNVKWEQSRLMSQQMASGVAEEIEQGKTWRMS